MAGPVNEEFDALVKVLNESNYSKEESIHILGEYVKSIISNNVPMDQRWGASMITGDFIKRVRQHDWKFANGFFGNWAKSAVEGKKGKVEEYDDGYTGC